MDSFRKCSRAELRFLHEPNSVDTLLDDIQLGTNWVTALGGLSLEMKFAEYGRWCWGREYQYIHCFVR